MATAPPLGRHCTKEIEWAELRSLPRFPISFKPIDSVQSANMQHLISLLLQARGQTEVGRMCNKGREATPRAMMPRLQAIAADVPACVGHHGTNTRCPSTPTDARALSNGRSYAQCHASQHRSSPYKAFERPTCRCHHQHVNNTRDHGAPSNKARPNIPHSFRFDSVQTKTTCI